MSDRGPGIHFPPPLLYAIPFVVGWLIHRTTPLAIATSGAWWLAAVAIGLGFVWAAVFGWAFFSLVRGGATLRPDRPTKALVTTGPYAVSRNPLYLAFGVLYVALALLVNSLWPLFFLPPAVFAIDRWVIRREERYLAGVFGQRYEEYCRRVRRWL